MDRLDVHATLLLSPEPTAARTARQFISDFCNAASLRPETCEVAAVLTKRADH